jgi:hypothetical protein
VKIQRSPDEIEKIRDYGNNDIKEEENIIIKESVIK